MDFGLFISDIGSSEVASIVRVRSNRQEKSALGNARCNARSAFTFIELMLGLAITSMVMVALGAVMFAVARGWQGAEMGQSIEMAANQASLRVERMIQESKLTGVVREGTTDTSALARSVTPAAAIMLWKSDRNGDERIQFDEIALIEHNRTAGTLDLFEARWPDGWTASQIALANTELSQADLTDANAPEDIKALLYVARKPILGGVRGAKFHLIDPAAERSSPSLEFTLTLRRGGMTGDSALVQAGRDGTYYRTASLRGANFKPAAGYTAWGPTTQPVVFNN